MELATASDLDQWAQRRDAQAMLPQLVRRLIAATADGLSRIAARAGEGVALPGWDGTAQAANASPFVPGGLSVWEMGVGDPGAKARADYLKRTREPFTADPATTTFVFVTPRRWKGKENWAKARTEEGAWKAVVAYDADDLETWLESAPAVHAWISVVLGKDPHEAEALETWWTTWSGATRPSLPPAVILSGRQQEAEQLRAILGAGPDTTSVAADSQNEALAFIAATLLARGDPSLIERSLVVRSARAWRRLSVSPSPLVLLPSFEGPAVASAVNSGHHVVLPLGREVASGRGIALPRLRRAGIEAALSEAGLSRERASVLATLGRRSLLSLRRTLAVNPDSEVPVWARPEHARDIALAILAGSWNDASEGDRQAIAAIAGRPYEEVARSLTRWLNTSDPPVRRVGEVWMVAAKADAWSLTARALTADDLDRFREVSISVLGADDPALALPRGQRMMAGLLGQQRHHSGHLVRGIADTLALLAAASDHVSLAGSRRGDSEANAVVRALLAAANEDPSGRRWHALSDVLPLLAEAAPTHLLQAVEVGSQTADGPVLHLFQDGDEASWHSPGSPHSSLLWALETLAWSPEHLPHAALRLAALTRMEPGGHTLNRPFNSLCDILLLWHPGTAASLDQRVQVVDLLRHHEPEVAWSLMLRLIPTGQESASATSSPDHRDWKPEGTEGVTVVELFRAIDAIVERATKDADTQGRRWAALLERVGGTSLPARDRVIEALGKVDPSTLDCEGRTTLYRTLKHVVNRHRQYAHAEWSLSAAAVNSLSALIPAFEPVAPTARHGWLFEQSALDAFVAEDRGDRRRSLDEAQDAALRDILGGIGFNGLLEWAATLKDQQFSALQIGETLARGQHDPTAILALLGSDREMDRRIALQYAACIARSQGLPWAKGTLERFGSGWPPQLQALFLRALPASPEVWSLAESLGPETDRLYWACVHPYALPTDRANVRVAAERLTTAGQPGAALHLFTMLAHHDPDGIPLAVLAHALEEHIRNAPAEFDVTLADEIGKHLDRLDEGGFDRDRLAQLEWAYLPLFRFEKRESRVLHRALAEQPEFFVTIVSLVFRAPGEEPHELSDFEQAQARSAHELLDSWRSVPGTRPDRTLDAEALGAWLREARERLVAANRLDPGDRSIGRVLRYGPPAQHAQSTENAVSDDITEPAHFEWPAKPIRDLIENAASEHLERGFQMEIYNSRGVTSRALTEGGEQERALAKLYRQYAMFAGIRWPRTAAMLVRIADSYERDAARHDRDADLTEDTWR